MAAIAQPFIVVFKAKEVNLVLLTIPIAPNALKNGGAVVKAMGHNSYLGFRQRDKLLVEVGI